jgi:hypothetical protein
MTAHVSWRFPLRDPRSVPRPPYYPAIAVYDRVYRFLHGIDQPQSQVGSALRIELCRNSRVLRFTDGTIVQRGKRVGVLHLNNDYMHTLHGVCPSPINVGMEFRRQFQASLRDLAHKIGEAERFVGVNAFAATTIFHQNLRRFGFETASDHLLCPMLVAFYQRALLACLHPEGSLRLHPAAYRRAERLWISRRTLEELWGARPGKRAGQSRRRPRSAAALSTAGSRKVVLP